jgi:hypothetical protein
MVKTKKSVAAIAPIEEPVMEPVENKTTVYKAYLANPVVTVRSNTLEKLKRAELHDLLKSLGLKNKIKGYSKLKKNELVSELSKHVMIRAE